MQINEFKKENTRFNVIDVIRGIAVLGILLMNIQSFSMIGQAYLNPTAYGNFTGVNKWVWILSHVFADQKFMSIFSILFGASVILITEKAEQNNVSSVKLHYKRNFWLLIFGLIHAYLIWYGEILTPYAICAFLVYPLRKLSLKKLMIVGIAFFSITSLISINSGLEIINLPDEIVQQISRGWSPNQKIIDREVNAYLGDYSQQLSQRYKTTKMMHLSFFPSHYLWRILGLMLIGMSLFKSGFLIGKLKKELYKRTIVYLGSSGLILIIIGLIKNFDNSWSIKYSMFFGNQFNYWGALMMSLAYLSAIILIYKNGYLKHFTKIIIPVGKTALSNYVFQSIICTMLFYGFNLFGKTERIHQLLIVFCIWFIQIYLSNIWVKHFEHGPLEFIWRSLYKKSEPKFQKSLR